ncbi:MAG: hypothetical protein K2G40_05520 [Muribaculaceae bacterium]|nr:hypothetical protein [Muribaculaceae bacterium]
MKNVQENNDNSRERIAALVVTVFLHVALILMAVYLFLEPKTDTEAVFPEEEEQADITFEEVVDYVVGGAYIKPVPIPEPVPEPVLSEGAQVTAAPAPQPDPAEIQQKKAEEIHKRVKFNTQVQSDNEGEGGQAAETNAESMDVNTEVVGLEGFSSEGFPRPSGFSDVGTIAISVTLDATGRVIATNFLAAKGNGAIKQNRQAIAACLDAASRSKFSARPGTSSGATGTIYYHFKK